MHHIWPNQFYYSNNAFLFVISCILFSLQLFHLWAPIPSPNSAQFLSFCFSPPLNMYSLIVLFLFPFETLQNTFANIQYIETGSPMNSILPNPVVNSCYPLYFSYQSCSSFPILCYLKSHHHYLPFRLLYKLSAGLFAPSFSSLQLEEFHEDAEYIIMLLCSNSPFLRTIKAHRLYNADPLDLDP